MKKVAALFFLSIFSSFLFANTVKSFTLKQVENPKNAVNEVLKVFKEQIRAPITKLIIKIPYNINYSETLNNKVYYIVEYKVNIIYKIVGEKLVTNEKDYIIRFIVNVSTQKTDKEEIYSLTKETTYSPSSF